MAVRHSGLIWALPCPEAQAATVESAPSPIGRITLGMRRAGVRSAGNPHAAYDVAGVGNGVAGRIEAPADGESCRQQLLPVPTATAPAPDPTGEGALEKYPLGQLAGVLLYHMHGSEAESAGATPLT